MNGDKLVFDLAQETDSAPNVFIKKDWVNILDNQNGVYSSNQSVIDTSQLTNSNKFMNLREAYLAVPMLLSVATTTLATAGGFLPGGVSPGTNSADYAIGLKNWFGQIIHSLSVDLNGTTIVQQTAFCNMWNGFKLMTSMSWGDVATQGASIGFYPDDPLSWAFFNADNASGRGVCNNTNASNNALGAVVAVTFNRYKAGNGNLGFLKRQQYINYDSLGDNGTGTYAGQLTDAQSATLWKSYISRKVNGVNNTTHGSFQISIMGFIHLKHLHSFFNSAPLLKGVFLKMTLALNNTTIEFASTGYGTPLVLSSVSNAVGGVCPIMLASASGVADIVTVAQGGSSTWGTASYRANLSVGATCLDSNIVGSVGAGTLARSIYLYAPMYSFNPIFESAYLSSPIKTIAYTDIYQYQILNVTASTGQINSLVSNGIAGIKSVLVIPFYSASTNLVLTGATGFLPAYQSPYDPAGCCATSPLAHLTNFNVVISGQNMLYNTQRYTFEQWLNNLYGTNAVNAGEIDGLTSGLIDQLGFEMEQCYYYVDCSRMLDVEQSVPKSVQIIGQNACSQALDLFVFVEYSAKVSIDALTGARV